MLRQMAQDLVVRGQDRLLDERQAIGPQGIHQGLCHGLVHAAMEVHGNVHLVANRLAHGCDAGGRLIHASNGIHIVRRAHGAELDQSVALPLGQQRVLSQGLFVRAADAAVDLDPLLHGAAQQLVHRHAEHLALDVPQRLIDAGNGAHEHRTAPVERAAVQGLPQMLDGERILADEHVGKLPDSGGHRGGTPFHDRLTPPANALVGFDLQV